jgi:hypothetical protein
MVWAVSYGTLLILTIDVLQRLICFYITSCSKSKHQGSLNHYPELMVLVIRFTLDISILYYMTHIESHLEYSVAVIVYFVFVAGCRYHMFVPFCCRIFIPIYCGLHKLECGRASEVRHRVIRQ